MLCACPHVGQGQALPLPKISMSYDLAQRGWGIILPQSAHVTTLTALQPLLDLRQQQAADKFYIFAAQNGYQPHEGYSHFLHRQDGLPYYLLIVGSPQEIPFQFQQLANISHAVGRLDFDSPDDYAAYARQVVAAETTPSPQPSPIGRGNILSPLSHKERGGGEGVLPLDRQIALESSHQVTSSHLMTTQIFDHLARYLQAKHPTWSISATADNPALRFVIDSSLYKVQNLIKADATSAYLGQIIIHFGNNTLGTPPYNEATDPRTLITEQPFTAPAAQEALRQGALAIMGNVGEVWDYSFSWQPPSLPPDSGGMKGGVATVESFFDRLLTGQSIGHASEFFGHRYAEIASDLKVMQDDIRVGESYLVEEVTQLRQAKAEAGSWQLLGDPAVSIQPVS